LLDLLPQEDRDSIATRLERVTLKHKDVFFEPDKPIEFVHFPISCVASVLNLMEDGGIVEVGTIGNEGMVGLPVIWGGRAEPHQCVCQVPGESLRIPAAAFVAELSSNVGLRRNVNLYAQAYYTQVAQSTACNRRHPVEMRLARWLLMTHDRLDGDTLNLTQEFIADMLGVRRASVSVVAAVLQQAGMIRYRRGVVQILNREALEEASCECYGVVRAEFQRLLC
jgi:CRP-like cAMP-binding protein